MNDISDLIKEAKPLYFKRKRRNNLIKGSSVFVAIGLLMFAFMPQNNTDYSYWNLGENEYQQASAIEQMGLPVDDYGLLKVS